jgi:hypothetical protein
MEHHSAMNKNEIMSKLAGKWLELETIMLNDTSQSLKAKYCMLPLI